MTKESELFLLDSSVRSTNSSFTTASVEQERSMDNTTTSIAATSISTIEGTATSMIKASPGTSFLSLGASVRITPSAANSGCTSSSSCSTIASAASTSSGPPLRTTTPVVYKDRAAASPVVVSTHSHRGVGALTTSPMILAKNTHKQLPKNHDGRLILSSCSNSTASSQDNGTVSSFFDDTVDETATASLLMPHNNKTSTHTMKTRGKRFSKKKRPSPVNYDQLEKNEDQFTPVSRPTKKHRRSSKNTITKESPTTRNAPNCPLEPTPKDVLLGRGYVFQNHPGNIHAKQVAHDKVQELLLLPHNNSATTDTTNRSTTHHKATIPSALIQQTLQEFKQEGRRFLIQKQTLSSLKRKQELRNNSSNIMQWEIASEESSYEKIKRIMMDAFLILKSCSNSNLTTYDGKKTGQSLRSTGGKRKETTRESKDLNQKDEEDVLVAEKKPTEHDVLLGRGRITSCHPGNRNLHQLVEERFEQYEKAKRNEKPIIANGILELLSQKGVRFLKEIDGGWVEVSYEIRYEKICQSFRDTKRLLPKCRKPSVPKAVAKKPKSNTKRTVAVSNETYTSLSRRELHPLLMNSPPRETSRSSVLSLSESPSILGKKTHLEEDAVDALRSLMRI